MKTIFSLLCFLVSTSSFCDNSINLISSGVDPKGAMKSIESALKTKGETAIFWHKDTEQAIKNFLDYGKCIDKINIYGHGGAGYIETGWGDPSPKDPPENPDSEKFVAIWNRLVWKPYFAQIKTADYKEIYLCGCHTGAGEEGADFLFNMAKITKHPVSAPTGLVFSNHKDIWFAGVLQRATPEKRPTPIPSPDPKYRDFVTVNYYKNGDGTEINYSDIDSIKISKDGSDYSLEKKYFDDFCSHLFATMPEKTPGFVVGAADIKTVTIKTRVFEKSYTVYNNSYVVDLKEQVGYYTHPAVKKYFGFHD